MEATVRVPLFVYQDLETDLYQATVVVRLRMVVVVVAAAPGTEVATAAAMAIHLDPAANPPGGKDSALMNGSLPPCWAPWTR